ncbi:MAG: pyridoxamine 5'-phosphate oxidase family protein [Acidimicrobiales bacterium]
MAGSDPAALPVNFVLVDCAVAFRTGARQATRLGTSATVGFEVDRIDEAMSEGWSVLVAGAAHVVEDPAMGTRLQTLDVEPWAGGDRPIFVPIAPHHISGRAIRLLPTRTSPR